MFEALAARTARRAERRAGARARLIAEEIARDAPRAVRVEAVPDGIRLTGPGSALRWIMAGLKR
jgi:hypothetical protein